MSDYSWDSKVPAKAEQKEFSVPPIGEAHHPSPCARFYGRLLS